MDLGHWNALFERMGWQPDAVTHRALIDAYSAPGRYYHNCDHLSDCLLLIEIYADVATRPGEVELALWFHDAIYKIGSRSNELDSANWAVACLSKVGADGACCTRIHKSILATGHSERSLTGDTALVVDIDLSILGRDVAIYQQFERDIRKEYQQVPDLVFRTRRRALLRSFLQREHIYYTEVIRQRYEAQARRNLQAAIAALD